MYFFKVLLKESCSSWEDVSPAMDTEETLLDPPSVTTDRSPSLREPHFPCLENGCYNSGHSTKLFRGLKAVFCVNGLAPGPPCRQLSVDK